MSRVLCQALLSKIEEQLDRAAHLAALLPADSAHAPEAAFTPGDLLGHLLDCMAGVCAALYAAEPESLSYFNKLRLLPINQSLPPVDFCAHAATFRLHIAQGFELLDDAALARSIATVFVPAGLPLITLLLGNLEHLINHKRQLFEMLKQSNVKVGTADLYCLSA